ncbi:nucleotide-diphospho-sugar transferase [Clohesyomyces aquaticus]|uniref:Nucleotide-diphospho-sugar transferase n=1 Tax=Clohesyomyces aquaticus TaxID=1231657 RepID=A0A1Y1Z388_9PLEO|nr:nucleotide-diphospho-sugar transferase [Clohesyomyces aquaticus]
MRRKRSLSLPRYVTPGSAPESARSFSWPRRSRILALAGICLLYWFFFTGNHNKNKNVAVDTTDYSHFAYSLYATDSATLCHAVLVFDALERLGSKADRVLWYPNYWDTVVTNSKDRDSQLLVMARDRYRVRLRPEKLLSVGGRGKDAWTGTWDKSVTKFLAFTLTSYNRVIALDSDITLLSSLDHLFLLPPTHIAMPRAYWWPTQPQPLTSLLMVLQPSMREFEYFKSVIDNGGSQEAVASRRFDMEMVNERFGGSAMVLPQRPYALLTGEFRTHDHAAYLGSPPSLPSSPSPSSPSNANAESEVQSKSEVWDADKMYSEAKLVHFSDWPLPKPWIMWPHEGLVEMQPDCGGSHSETPCAERRIWKGLYEDFRRRRKDVCRLLSVPAPEWGRIKGGGSTGSRNETEGTHHEAEKVDMDMKTEGKEGGVKGPHDI